MKERRVWEPQAAEKPWQDEPQERERLNVDVSADEHASLVSLTGELDLATVPRLRRALYDAAWGPPMVRVDLRATSFMDLGALRVLVEAAATLRAGGRRMVVVVAPGRRPRVMTVVPFAAALTVEERPDDEADLH